MHVIPAPLIGKVEKRGISSLGSRKLNKAHFAKVLNYAGECSPGTEC